MKRFVKFNIFFIGILFSFFACIQEKSSQEKSDNIIDKHIELPDSSLIITKSGIKKINSSELESDVMIISTIIGTCDQCIRKISLWKDFKNNFLIEDIKIIIYIDIDNYDWFIKNMEPKIERVDNLFIVFVDDFKFHKINKIPINIAYDTFLIIDKNVVLQGVSIENEIMKEKYRNEIIKKILS